MSILENKLKAELKLAAFLRGWLISRFEIGKFANHFASKRIGRYSDVIELDDAVNIEKILKLTEYF